ncbi:acetyltransferase (GNAT) family protein [Flavobacteriaceae bacterium MAR_2010_105]|nr:acetyltransferase (GNAT) family protein [Flavobacteriaceae bacterium MAR_2010_105]
MSFSFKIIDASEINSIIPLVQKLTNHKFSDALLQERFAEMVTQNYECAGVYDGDTLIGISGMWYCTRHYAGKSMEVDHVFIDDAYRNKGIGKQFFKWMYDYVKAKGYASVELNTYVQNYPSHKFYYNEGFEILGYHFFKTL